MNMVAIAKDRTTRAYLDGIQRFLMRILFVLIYWVLLQIVFIFAYGILWSLSLIVKLIKS